jgi:putative NADPH-quinone reductase
MSRRIVLIQGHPDPAPSHLCHALAEAYAEAAEAAGHAVTRIDIARLDVPFLRRIEDFHGRDVLPALAQAHADILAADHIVLVFPLWLGTMPALVKAFLEQVIRPAEARPDMTDFPGRVLAGRSVRMVVTMGMPALFYRLWYCAHGVAGLKRSVFGFTGARPVRVSYCGRVEAASAATRAGWLKTMRHLGRLAA